MIDFRCCFRQRSLVLFILLWSAVFFAGVVDQAVLLPMVAWHSEEIAHVTIARSHAAGVSFSPSVCERASSNKFDQIYKRGKWGPPVLAHGPEYFYADAQWPPPARVSASGGGSNLGSSTLKSLAILKDVIANYGVKSMIDVPCGDVNWIFDSYATDSLPLYLGLDITQDVINMDIKRFAHHSNKHFMYWDAANCSFPKFQMESSAELQPFELVHVRDVIQHLPLEDGFRYICNVLQSGARVFVTTTFPKNNRNRNIEAGKHYHNNLHKPPFSFPQVNSTVCRETHPLHEADSTCVYNLTEPWVADYIVEKCIATTAE